MLVYPSVARDAQMKPVIGCAFPANTTPQDVMEQCGPVPTVRFLHFARTLGATPDLRFGRGSEIGLAHEPDGPETSRSLHP